MFSPLNESYIGIDPGLNGAIAVISSTFTTARPMFVTKERNKKRIYIPDLYTYLKMEKKHSDIKLCVVEEVHAMPKQGVTSMFNFGMGYGILLGVLGALEIKTLLVTPQEWKKFVLPNTKKDKDAAIKFCQKQYPDVSLYPGKKRKPHDGMADALCLATFARCYTFNEETNDNI